MPGYVKVSDDNRDLVIAYYKSAQERNSILSFFNLLYELQNYTITTHPDDCTESEIATQVTDAGCAYAYMRADSIHDTGSRANSALAS